MKFFLARLKLFQPNWFNLLNDDAYAEFIKSCYTYRETRQKKKVWLKPIVQLCQNNPFTIRGFLKSRRENQALTGCSWEFAWLKAIGEPK